jgi:hypothetical protein
MQYLEGIIINIKDLDSLFKIKKEFGKIIIEINYQNGIYVCDSIKQEITSKRINK